MFLIFFFFFRTLTVNSVSDLFALLFVLFLVYGIAYSNVGRGSRSHVELLLLVCYSNVCASLTVTVHIRMTESFAPMPHGLSAVQPIQERFDFNDNIWGWDVAQLIGHRTGTQPTQV